ncbi:MAG: hypothetical protein CM1200mP39_28930 [Dehalococcoidia bacterium]|nr:MAG: hypothetical protein CM1200mP39_28930 [Dehalococcoidia bacterium]
MTSQRTTQGARPTFRRGGRRRRQCFCKESKVDYKDVSNIRRFITDRGRIEAGKKSGNCAKCQRTLTLAIKRARHLALLPYAPHHLRVTGEVAVSAKISEDDDAVVLTLRKSLMRSSNPLSKLKSLRSHLLRIPNRNQDQKFNQRLQ